MHILCFVQRYSGCTTIKYTWGMFGSITIFESITLQAFTKYALVILHSIKHKISILYWCLAWLHSLCKLSIEQSSCCYFHISNSNRIEFLMVNYWQLGCQYFTIHLHFSLLLCKKQQPAIFPNKRLLLYSPKYT